VGAAEGFVAGEAFEGFDAEREFADGQRAFGGQAAFAEAGEVFGDGVFRAVVGVAGSDIVARKKSYGTREETGMIAGCGNYAFNVKILKNTTGSEW
jgi:hypothetical protein